jgi:hypothetical protein
MTGINFKNTIIGKNPQTLYVILFSIFLLSTFIFVLIYINTQKVNMFGNRRQEEGEFSFKMTNWLQGSEEYIGVSSDLSYIYTNQLPLNSLSCFQGYVDKNLYEDIQTFVNSYNIINFDDTLDHSSDSIEKVCDGGKSFSVNIDGISNSIHSDCNTSKKVNDLFKNIDIYSQSLREQFQKDNNTCNPGVYISLYNIGKCEEVIEKELYWYNKIQSNIVTLTTLDISEQLAYQSIGFYILAKGDYKVSKYVDKILDIDSQCYIMKEFLWEL